MEGQYTNYYNHLLAGATGKPRGLTTHCERNVTFGYIPGMFPRRRKDNPAIGIMELLQTIVGTFSIDDIARVAPNANLVLFGTQSAYGLRTRGQWQSAIRELSEDIYSRRAVVVLSNLNEFNSERPCTLSIQFQIAEYEPGRDGLTSTTYMRSSDAVWGLPYDLIQFGGMTQIVANCLNLPAIMSTIFIGNAHVYDHHLVSGNWTDAFFTLPMLSTFEAYQDWALAMLERKLQRKELEEAFQLWRMESLSTLIP